MQQNEKIHNVKSDVAKREEEILKFWSIDKTFEKSLQKVSPKGNYVFYDGPPFATGTPHYGHILGSTAKDVIGRYKTMQGYHVPRRWGWDCHGLPIENIVEKDLKISGRKAIEEYGIEKFTEYARSKVLTYVDEWKKTVERIGRWVDFDNSYKTMDNNFIESVWWAFGELQKKDLIYEGVRVLAYCPRCETPIANSEIAMDNSYKDITDISITTEFELVDSPGTYVIAWTTTPWTTPGNVALAVGPDIEYAEVEGEVPGNKYILAKDRVEANFKTAHQVLRVFKGSELIGKSYKPLFDYYAKDTNLKNRENGWKIYGADFVTLDQGTGVVHIAPAFGEDDKRLGDEKSLPLVIHVDATGHFKPEVADFAGQSVKPKEDHQSGDVLIIKNLAGKGLLFSKEKIVHSYPHCHRCETPLYYYALPSWFVNIQKEKEHILKRAESMSWVPAHLKDGRFKAGVEGAPDWTISRNRYWASPLPIWKSESGKVMFVNSLDDLKKKTKKSGNKYYIMRHGEATTNAQNILSCDISGYPLTEKGREQARNGAMAIKDEQIDMIMSSDIERARQTAEMVAEVIGYDKSSIKHDVRLRELNFGVHNNIDVEEYVRRFPNNTKAGLIEVPEGGESRISVKRRVMELLYELENTHQGKRILIISHGDPLWHMYSGALGMSTDEIVTNPPLYPQNGMVNKLDFTPIPHNANYELDFHRPYIDEITLVDDLGEEYHRIPEVLDCWFESGSMPFAQDHYPFDFTQGMPLESKNWQKENFPAGFVAEYIPQTRTWFYYTHALSTILFDHAPFEYVVTTGTVLAEDGAKMSKSKNNFPDPAVVFDRYGVDALRLYLMNSPLMKGEDLNFSERTLDELYKKVIMRLGNVLSFYVLYSEPKTPGVSKHDPDTGCPNPSNILDQWILSRLDQLVSETTRYMELYELDRAARPIFDFVDDLSTWYLRRSRDRFKSDDVKDREVAIQTTRYVLETTAKVVAPLMPFIAEYIHKELGNTESVHLADWPTVRGSTSHSGELLEQMEQVRKIASLGLEARAREKIPVRQPLAELRIKPARTTEDVQSGGNYELRGKDALLALIRDEVNVKNIAFVESLALEVELDTNITDELRQEGELRELIRAVQELRKTKGLGPQQIINLTLPDTYQQLVKKFDVELKKSVRAERIIFGSVAEMSLEVI